MVLENLENLEKSGNFYMVKENLEKLEKSRNFVNFFQKDSGHFSQLPFISDTHIISDRKIYLQYKTQIEMMHEKVG